MQRMKGSRFCLICLLTVLLTGIVQTASGFSFSFSTGSSHSSANAPYMTTNRPWGNIGEFKPGLPVDNNYSYNYKSDANGYSYSYNYQTGNNGAENGYYLGGAPGTGWPAMASPVMPQQPYAAYPGQMTGASSAPGGQPTVEVEVSERSPFEQQNIVYTVRVVSSDNLKTLNPILPRIDGAALQKVDGPVASSRTDERGGGAANCKYLPF